RLSSVLPTFLASLATFLPNRLPPFQHCLKHCRSNHIPQGPVAVAQRLSSVISSLLATFLASLAACPPCRLLRLLATHATCPYDCKNHQRKRNTSHGCNLL